MKRSGGGGGGIGMGIGMNVGGVGSGISGGSMVLVNEDLNMPALSSSNVLPSIASLLEDQQQLEQQQQQQQQKGVVLLHGGTGQQQHVVGGADSQQQITTTTIATTNSIADSSQMYLSSQVPRPMSESVATMTTPTINGSGHSSASGMTLPDNFFFQ